MLVQVIKAMLALNHDIQKTISSINRYVDSWRRHQSLWKTEKSSVLDKFKTKDPSNAEFEEKLAKYSKVRDTVLCLCGSLSSRCKYANAIQPQHSTVLPLLRIQLAAALCIHPANSLLTLESLCRNSWLRSCGLRRRT
jgi:hypothetical protein